MTSPRRSHLPTSGTWLAARLAIAGALLAVLALGALAVWATMLTQNNSHGLSRAGVQTSGHLRAVRALSQIDTQSELLEQRLDPRIVTDLRDAERVLAESLQRMQAGGVIEERRLAHVAMPTVQSLSVALDAYLNTVALDGNDDVVAQAGEQMEDVLDDLQGRFNEVGIDPSEPLRAETAAAAADERLIHRTALVLIPLGLLLVAFCFWQLRAYRKRSEAQRERLEAELRLGQRLEAVGQLASGIAHEINTPIQFVGDSVRFLEDAFDDLRELETEYRAVCASIADDDSAIRARIARAEEYADVEYLHERIPLAFERTRDGLGRVASIVAAMKGFGRPTQVDHAPADLNEAIGSTLVVAQNEYKYVADVETSLGELPLVSCNVSELNQVFLNLIINAAHAIEDAAAADGSGEKGRIRIRTARENGSAVITISDNGPGIPADIRDRIYDPFFTTKEIGRGTGQGLAIARTIVVDKHDGSLTVDSEPGHGTTFAIHLPIREAAAVD
jgi:signal transduction histidine kinase